MVFRRILSVSLKSFNEVVNREAGVASLDDQHFHHVFQTFCLDADPAFPYKRSLTADGLDHTLTLQVPVCLGDRVRVDSQLDGKFADCRQLVARVQSAESYTIPDQLNDLEVHGYTIIRVHIEFHLHPLLYYYDSTICPDVKSWLRTRGVRSQMYQSPVTVSYTHLRAHETRHELVCRLLLEKK